MFPLVLVGSSREKVISGTCVLLESCNANVSAGGVSTPCFCDNLPHFNTFQDLLVSCFRCNLTFPISLSYRCFIPCDHFRTSLAEGPKRQQIDHVCAWLRWMHEQLRNLLTCHYHILKISWEMSHKIGAWSSSAFKRIVRMKNSDRIFTLFHCIFCGETYNNSPTSDHCSPAV